MRLEPVRSSYRSVCSEDRQHAQKKISFDFCLFGTFGDSSGIKNADQVKIKADLLLGMLTIF